MRTPIAILLTLFFLVTVGRAFGLTLPGKDSLKPKFGVNDPRNPDCPCHKYQQLAEKEYAGLFGNEKSASEKSRGTKTRLLNRKNVLFHKLWMKCGRREKVKRFHPDYSRCYRW
jgi:hypothetical protein